MDINAIKGDLEDHGELHLVVEEHDAVVGPNEDYIGLRNGNTTFDDENEVIVVQDGTTYHCISYDSVVYYHAPVNFPD